jgi:uncharacterized damage-inducible protein DinB
MRGVKIFANEIRHRGAVMLLVDSGCAVSPRTRSTDVLESETARRAMSATGGFG